MENLTHSLIGATLSELFVPRSASPAKRGFFFTVGVVAANLPDADLLYTRITPPPLGYLLHHRGHTHTFVGIAVLGLAFGALLLIPRVRRGLADCQGRFWGLIACALLSHIVADGWNSYGVHPFWPFDNRWYYSDAIYIYEPWLWVIFGVTVAMNTHARSTKFALSALLLALPLAMTGLRIISPVLLGTLAVGAAAWAVATVRVSSVRRAGTSLAVAALFVTGMFALSRLARAKIGPSLADTPRGEMVDAIMNPRTANPLCWTTIVVERNREADAYTLRRGTISIVPGGCSSLWEHAWAPADTQSLSGLRALSASNCRVNAWLRFGRAPYVRGGRIADHRFGGAGQANFSSMLIDDGADPKACPPNIPPWEMPRADLLGGP
jgi:inner membrane protein